MTDTFFAISYTPLLLPLLSLLGLGPAWSGVWVDRDAVRVQMGWGFRARIRRESVRTVARDSAAVTGWGVHGWRGRWLVNGSSAGMVRIKIEPPARAWTMGVPVRLHMLRLSTTRPDELVTLLSCGR
jgi:hypothetical protein